MIEAAELAIGLLVLYGAARLGGAVAGRIHLPRVVGELLAGVVLGPTVLGSLWPELPGRLFPTAGSVSNLREIILRGVLLFFLLGAGVDVKWEKVRSQFRAVLSTSFLGILLPFGIGAGLVLAAPGMWGTDEGSRILQACFMGTALSITALPVILRILTENGLVEKAVGRVVMAAATVNDLIGWVLFSLLVVFAGGSPTWGELVLIAFLAGVGLSSRLRKTRAGRLILHLSRGLAPIYFASVGLRADYLSDIDLVQVLVVCLAATAGKLGGAYWGARWGGFEIRDARTVAFLMNARGVMEVALASIALETGMIDRTLFVSLVVMAMLTTAAAGVTVRGVFERPGSMPQARRPWAAPEPREAG